MGSHICDVNNKNMLVLQEENEKKLKQTFSNVHNYIREYNETTGIQGLHYLTGDRSTTEKIVWGIILLISLSGCFLMIYEIVKKYENSPIVIGFANEPGFIHQIPFPAITICPITTVSNDKFSYKDIKLKLKKNISLTDEERRIFYYMRFMCDESTFLYKEDANYTLNGEGILDVIKEVAPHSPFAFCEFMNEEYNCTDIFTRVLTSDGICYSFNIMDRSEIFKNQVFHYEDFHQIGRNSSAFDGESGYNGKISADVYPERAFIASWSQGLLLGLIQLTKEINKFCDPFMKGYQMRMHLPSETYESGSGNTYPLPLDESSILSITPELIKTSDRIKNYNVEKRKCYLKGEKQLKYFQIYTQSNCDLECLTNVTLSQCRCVDFYMPRMNGTEVICSLELHDCIDEAEKHYFQKAVENKGANSDLTNYYIGCNCLPLCTELKYNLDILPLDIQKDNKYWKKSAKAHSTDKSVSMLFINFKSSSFSVLERNELYGVTDLICNFGALLGLFTGFSFISLAEIIYFLTLRIWCNIRLYGRWSGPPV